MARAKKSSKRAAAPRVAAPSVTSIDIRLTVPEAARALRISRAHLYRRISEKAIKAQHDGTRTFISLKALAAYVEHADAMAEGAQ